jgi:uncharacterized protein (TIGR02646 family)
MRLHGSNIIQRRKDVLHCSNYKEYRENLREDFCHICGYCGKYELHSHGGMEIDHFVPKKVDPSKINEYENLVYSCFTCNRKKYEKWPTNDKDKPHDDKIGLVDPASAELDTHLGRAGDGQIVYYTSVGKYMFEKVFRFDIRPTKAIWQAYQLHSLAEKLDHIDTTTMSSERKTEYITALKELRGLEAYLFEKKE